MAEHWTGQIVGRMHNHKISKTDLATHMGVTREYVSMILNQHRTPIGAKEKFSQALDEIISTRETEVRDERRT